MPNPKLYIDDLSGATVISLYLTRNFAVLELQLQKTLKSQIQLNMNAEMNGRPYMAGELEKDAFLRKSFYLGQIYTHVNQITLLPDNTLVLDSTSSKGNNFSLQIPCKNETACAPWCVTQSDNNSSTREVFLECDKNGQITFPQNRTLNPLWFITEELHRDWQNDDSAINKLKGKRLVSLHFDIFPNRLFFLDANDTESSGEALELRVMNGARFEGNLPLRQKVMEDQYRNCDLTVFSYAQFLNLIVLQTTLTEKGDLILDFENNASIIVLGDPSQDRGNDILWSLLDARTNSVLTLHWATEGFAPFS